MANAGEELSLLRSEVSVPSYQTSQIPREWTAKVRAKVGELRTKDQRRHCIEAIVGGLGALGCFGGSFLAWKIGFFSWWGFFSTTGAMLSAVTTLGAISHWLETPNLADRTICKIVQDEQRTKTLIQRLTTGTLKSFADLINPDDPKLMHTSDFSEFEIIETTSSKRLNGLVGLRRMSKFVDLPDYNGLYQLVEGWLENEWQALQRNFISKEVPGAVAPVVDVV